MKTGDSKSDLDTELQSGQVESNGTGEKVGSLAAMTFSPGRQRTKLIKRKNGGGLRPIGHYSSRIVKRLEPKRD